VWRLDSDAALDLTSLYTELFVSLSNTRWLGIHAHILLSKGHNREKKGVSELRSNSIDCELEGKILRSFHLRGSKNTY